MAALPARKVSLHLLKRADIEADKMLEAIRAARRRVSANVRYAAKQKGMATSRLKREGLYRQASAFYGELAAGLDEQMRELVYGTSKLGLEQASAEIKDKAGAVPKSVRYSTDYARDIWSRIHPANGASIAAVFTQKMAEADIRALRTAFVDTYRQASLEGWPAGKIADNFRKAWTETAGGIEDGKFIDAVGKTWNDKAYAEMLTRTTITRTYQESYNEAIIKAGGDLVQIQNTGDACPFCQAWDQAIVSISGTSKDFPSMADAVATGFQHPNCLCVTTYVDPAADEDEIKKQEGIESPDLAIEGNTQSEARRENLAKIEKYHEKLTGKKTDAQKEAERKAEAKKSA